MGMFDCILLHNMQNIKSNIEYIVILLYRNILYHFFSHFMYHFCLTDRGCSFIESFTHDVLLLIRSLTYSPFCDMSRRVRPC